MKTMLLLSLLALVVPVQVRAADGPADAQDGMQNAQGARPDAWVTTKVKSALLFYPNVSGLGIDVETRDGVVTLKGEAENLAQKELASEYAQGIEGVKRVDNRITVKGERDGDLSDAAITARVKSALKSRNSTDALKAGVRTRGGVVTLTGTAKNDAQKDLAGKLAGEVMGVQDVENEIDVR